MPTHQDTAHVGRILVRAVRTHALGDAVQPVHPVAAHRLLGVIPDELKALRRWVPMKTPVWSDSMGKWLKVPTVKWSDSSTWRKFDGSFMLFVIGAGYVSYDADQCIDARGGLNPQIYAS